MGYNISDPKITDITIEFTNKDREVDNYLIIYINGCNIDEHCIFPHRFQRSLSLKKTDFEDGKATIKRNLVGCSENCFMLFTITFD